MAAPHCDGPPGWIAAPPRSTSPVEVGNSRSPLHRSCSPRRARRPRRRRDPGPLRAPLGTDLRVLRQPTRLARRSGGRAPVDVPERASCAAARRHTRGRARVVVQDRAQRLPYATPFDASSRPRRVAERLRRRAGRAACAAAGVTRESAAPDRGARAHAGEPAPRDSAPRVAGALVSRDRRRAEAVAVRGRDADLPGTSHARFEPRVRGEAAGRALTHAQGARRRAAARGDQGALRGRRGSEGRCRRGCRLGHRRRRDRSVGSALEARSAEAGAGRAGCGVCRARGLRADETRSSEAGRDQARPQERAARRRGADACRGDLSGPDPP